MSVHASVHSSITFYKRLHTSFLYEHKFTKVLCQQGHVCPNFWPHSEKQDGRHSCFLTPAPKAGVIVVACAVRAASAALAAAAGTKFAGVPHTKPMQWFHSNFQDMFTTKGSRADFGEYPLITVSMATLFQIFGSYTLRVFHRPNPCIDFHQIFRTCLAPNDWELIRFWGVSGNNCCHGNTLQFLGS